MLYDETGKHDIGSLGGQIATAHGINQSRVVVGVSDTVGFGMTHAFLYDGTGMQDLGTFGGSESWAYAINNSGQVAGSAYLTGNMQKHAFLFDANGMQDLGNLPGYPQSGSYTSGSHVDTVHLGQGAVVVKNYIVSVGPLAGAIPELPIHEENNLPSGAHSFQRRDLRQLQLHCDRLFADCSSFLGTLFNHAALHSVNDQPHWRPARLTARR